MTYEQRVQQIAEQMCIDNIDRLFGAGVYKSRNLTEKQRQDMMTHFMGAAHITVKHMAEAFENGARLSAGWYWLEYELPAEMKDQGLIPPKEGGKDE